MDLDSDALLLESLLSESDNSDVETQVSYKFGYNSFQNYGILQSNESIIAKFNLKKDANDIHGDFDVVEMDILESALMTDSESGEDDSDFDFSDYANAVLPSQPMEADIEQANGRISANPIVQQMLLDLLSHKNDIPSTVKASLVMSCRRYLESGNRNIATAISTKLENDPVKSSSNIYATFQCSEDVYFTSKAQGRSAFLSHRNSRCPAVTSICVGSNDGILLLGRENGELTIYMKEKKREINLTLQPLKSPQESRFHKRSQRSVTSIATVSLFTIGSPSLVLAGYSSGDVALWEVPAETDSEITIFPVKHLVGLHGHPIDWLYFLCSQPSAEDAPLLSIDAVSGDRKGNLYRIKITRTTAPSASSDSPVTYAVEHLCLLDGSSGPLISLATLPSLPLHIESGKQYSTSKGLIGAQIFSFSLSTVTCIVQMSPSLKILHKWPNAAANPSGTTAAGSETVTPHSFPVPCPLAWGWIANESEGILEARLLRGQASVLETMTVSAISSSTLAAVQSLSSDLSESSSHAAPQPPSPHSAAVATSTPSTYQSSFGLLPFKSYQIVSSNVPTSDKLEVAVGPSRNLSLLLGSDSSTLNSSLQGSMLLLDVRVLNDFDCKSKPSGFRVVCLSSSGMALLLSVELRTITVIASCRTLDSFPSWPFSGRFLGIPSSSGRRRLSLLMPQSAIWNVRLLSNLDLAVRPFFISLFCCL